MYDDLSPQAQRSITRQAFVARYKGITAQATIKRVQPLVVASATHGAAAAVTYTVDMSTTAVGAIRQTDTMPLRFAGRTLGHRLDAGPHLPRARLVATASTCSTETAHRGSIVDRLGQPLAVQGSMIQIGVVPEYIHDEKALLAFLSAFLHMPAARDPGQVQRLVGQAEPQRLRAHRTVSSVQWNAVPLTSAQSLEGNGLDIRSRAYGAAFTRAARSRRHCWAT